ncbi:glutaredoxin domain-containing protein, partial [Rhodococcus pyridinivorans]
MNITVYTKPACVQCTATYRALDKAGIEYDVVDISENPEARDYVMALGYLQAPVVVAEPHPQRVWRSVGSLDSLCHGIR